MLAELSAIAPFFAIVAIGWVAARRAVLTESGLAGLNAFIFTIALPPLLFQTMAAAPSLAQAAPFVAVYGAATLALYALGYILGWGVFGLGGGERALFAHLSCNGNVGFLGLPLAAAALGPEAVLPTTLTLTFDILVVMTLTTLLLERAAGAVRFARALWTAARSPIVLAVVGGLVWAQLGAPTPAPVAAVLDALGAAAAPSALVAVGATLAFKSGDRRVGELGALAVLKLAVAPVAIGAAFAAAAWATGDAMAPPLWIAAAILAAANPSSNNAVIFAGVYGRYEARASATVLISTALSLVSYSMVAAFIG